MSIFSIKHDYTHELTSLRKYFNQYNIEMQLVWIVEIIITMLYVQEFESVGSEFIKPHKSDSSRVITINSYAQHLLRRKGLPSSCFNKLLKFRDIYVHAGSDLAYASFKHLMTEYYADLTELAKFAGVQLNPQRSIYKSVEHRS